jgi:hypothetical protein
MNEIVEATFSKSHRDFEEIMDMLFYTMLRENKSNWKRTKKVVILINLMN